MNSIEILNEASNALMEFENALQHLAAGVGRITPEMHHLWELTNKLRALSRNIWATEVVLQEKNMHQLHIESKTDGNSIEIKLPYDMVAKSYLFRVYHRWLSNGNSLLTMRDAWSYLMQHVLRDITVPFKTPINNANIRVIVSYPNFRNRDADHFWFRPILDSFVYNRIITNDYASVVDLSFTYQIDKQDPCVRIILTPSE